MKCLNPECPNPSVVESRSFKFCPECGSSLDTALKSPENNQLNSEKRSQKEEEGAEQSSLKQNNGTTVRCNRKPEASSISSSELNDSDKEPDGPASDDGDKDQLGISSVTLEDASDGSGICEGQDRREDKDDKDGKEGKDAKEGKESIASFQATSSDDNCMTIVLHALLAPHFQFVLNQDRVVVRGDNPNFSGWTTDDLQMTPIRKLPDGYIVIEGTTTILLKNASKKFIYKYLVLKKDKDDNKEMWEELIDSPASNKAQVNRCFLIPEQYRKAKGVWHQYDDAVFSQPKFWESVRNKLPYMKVKLPCEGRDLAIRAVLPDWHSFGLDETTGTMKGEEFLGTINQVVHCMENLEAELNGKTESRALVDFSLEKVLLSYIEPRLENSYCDLAQTMKDENVQANQLATSLAIAAVVSNFIRKSSLSLKKQTLVRMLECLALSASLGKQRIERIMEILAQHYPRENWMKFSGAISELCHYAIKYHPDVHQWLLAVPMMHFMSNESRPYTDAFPLSEPTLRAQDTSYWGTNGIDVTEIQTSTSSSRLPIEFLNLLTPEFEVDPLLRKTFLFALPLSNFGSCVDQGAFLPYEVLWTLAYRVQNMKFYKPEELTSIDTCLNFVINLLDSKNKDNDESEIAYNSQDELTSLVKGSLPVLQCLLLPQLKDVFYLVCKVLHLLSKCLCLIKSAGSTMPETSTDGITKSDQPENTFCAKVLKEVTEKVQNRLSENFFGNLMQSHVQYRDEELKIWSTFLDVKLSDETLQACWQTKLLESLNARADKMDDMEKIVFYSTTNLNQLHEGVENCFQKIAFAAITRITETGREAEHAAKAFASLSQHDPNSIQSRSVCGMMSTLLNRCWPKDIEQQDNCSLLAHVLTWRPMANYLRYFNESSLTLPVDSQSLLTLTTSCLKNIHRMVSDASVTVKTLHILRGNEQKYCELIEIIGKSSDDIDKESEEDDEQDDTHKDFGRIYKRAQATLQKPLDELAAFEKEREQLRLFLRIRAILQYVDVKEIEEKAMTDVSQKAISDLAVHICDERGGPAQVQVIFFGLSEESKTMITTMHSIHKSKLFIAIWRRKFQDWKQNEQTMTLEEVYNQVWSPLFEKCKYILRNVLSGDITLGDVDRYFQCFKDRCVDLKEDLRVIMVACHGNAAADAAFEGISSQVDQIQLYHRLTSCITAADKILEFTENMDLNGDFKMVDTFRRQISQESKRQPLKSLREEFNQTGRILEKFTPHRLECLDAVMKSKDFIVWLKGKVPDPIEIKVLVDLAMMSAGEGDMESDRIAALHTCTRGFKPLIYSLKKDDDFGRLVELCQDVWVELEHNPRLPLQMIDTNRNLEWLKNVLEFHGSVTMSSLQQVETMMKHGTLTIGCHGNSEEINIKNVISLRVPPEKVKGLQRETYSLEDLKDLQSKLMLIAGKAAGQEPVDQFTEMLQGAIRLGTVYITLCETGEVSHLDWKKEFDFRQKNVIKELHNIYDEFNKFLEAWTDILNSQRKKCKELNYFTAKQLLYMRKEIAELKRGREFTSLDVQLYTLLDSILPGISSRSLKEALVGIDIDVDFLEENQLSLKSDEEEKIPDGDLRKKYEKFFNNIRKLHFPEEVALAAIVACDVPCDGSDLLMWSLENKDNEDDIQKLCDEGSQNPKFASLFPQESVTGETHDDEEEKTDIDRPMKHDDDRNFAAGLDQTLLGLYLSLEELSTLLACLATYATQESQQTMTFPGYLKVGKPNLLLVPQRDILPTVLGLYMECEGLPSRYEVLICTQDTTLEEVNLYLAVT